MRPSVPISEVRGARIITADRPGFGFSDPRPGRTLTDWARDVAELADALGIRRFFLAGVSGGGPYVLACAHALPDRVLRATVLGGAGPTDARRVLKGIAWERTAKSSGGMGTTHEPVARSEPWRAILRERHALRSVVKSRTSGS
jgi:pimeloyl-ACP methyl ester carboxylesterase